MIIALFDLGTTEIIMILIAVVVLFGRRLPELGRYVGRYLGRKTETMSRQGVQLWLLVLTLVLTWVFLAGLLLWGLPTIAK